MKYIRILALTMFFSQNCLAQKQYDSFEEKNYADWSLKFSPLGLLEPDQNLALGMEFRPIPSLGIQLEGSFIFQTLHLSNQRQIPFTRGFRVVPEFRWYDIDFKPNTNRYIGLQLSYKYVEKDIQTWVDRGIYQRYETISMQKFNAAAAIILGLQRHPDRIGFDFNLGLGIKYKQLLVLEQVGSSTPRGWPGNLYGEVADGFYPQLSATFKLCYRLL